MSHPARLAKIEALLDARGLHYEFEPNYPVARVRDAEGNQVRLVKNRAPKHAVVRYTEQMRAGATFPGIVLNAAGEVVDGNTRLAAARKLAREAIAAYVVSDLSQTVSRLLSMELNQCHGEVMSTKEVQAVVVATIRDGQDLNITSMARMTGLKPAKIRRWKRAEEARARVIESGLPAESFDQLKEPNRVALSAAKLRSVFVAAFKLAADADLTVGSLQDVINKANAAGSENDALAVIAAARESYAAEITAKATGLRPAGHRGAEAARYIGALVRFDAAELTDVAPEKAPEAIERMEALQGTIGQALTMLRATKANLAVVGSA
jgi:hypothetical protein